MPAGKEKSTVRPGAEVAGETDVGCQRQNNEDFYLYWEPAGDRDFQRKGRLAVVADGMGGHEGGQEASRIATEAIQEAFAGAPGDNPQETLLSGFRKAHDAVAQYAIVHPQLHGMGTTATAIALRGSQLYFAHIGDSRLYRVRGQEIVRLTRDHSYVGRLFENGVISAAEAEVHPQRHILTAALGTGPEISPDRPEQPIQVGSGDRFVLCTDGLWGLLADHDIQQIVAGNDPLVACRKMIQMARDRGGPDNITVVILRVD